MEVSRKCSKKVTEAHFSFICLTEPQEAFINMHLKPCLYFDVNGVCRIGFLIELFLVSSGSQWTFL